MFDIDLKSKKEKNYYYGISWKSDNYMASEAEKEQQNKVKTVIQKTNN